MATPPTDVRVALLGAGTVGAQVVRLLAERADDLAARAGAPLRLVGIAVSDADKEREPWIPRDLLTTDAEGLVRRADVVVELIGGIDPPRALVHAALEAGASVVTGNKALLAAHGPELHDAAAAADVDLYYEAAVAGAIPIVYALRESLAGDTVTEVLGIVNGTTNYVLDEMVTNGLGFDDAVAQAQALGFAEADPTADVDGHDSAAKAALLASLAFHTRVPLETVPVEGIRSITAEEMTAAQDHGWALKLLAVARRTGSPEGISVRVGPTLVPADHPLASVRGAFNAVVVESEAAGRLMFYGQGAGGAPTASAVLSDLVAAAGHVVGGGRAPRESAYADLAPLPPERQKVTAWFDLDIEDRPGMLSMVAAVLARHGISIEAVRQAAHAEPTAYGDELYDVFDDAYDGASPARATAADRESTTLSITTHRTDEATLAACLAELAESDGVRAVLPVRRVEGV
ncbi:homoserine dehydrogenase [Georgenia sp. Z1344]|uniref:homoserine dehydrogenase n=1 Tax=Georgenia sp. Z1344 TaxID=3416706 RepID=UPI003CEB82C2